MSPSDLYISELRFLFTVHGYRVVSSTTFAEAVADFCENSVDLVLMDFATLPDGNTVVAKLKEIAKHIPMIIMGDPKKMYGIAHKSDALLSRRMCSSAELLERVKIMAQRKRGPRKGIARAAAQPPLDVKQLSVAVHA